MEQISELFKDPYPPTVFDSVEIRLEECHYERWFEPFDLSMGEKNWVFNFEIQMENPGGTFVFPWYLKYEMKRDVPAFLRKHDVDLGDQMPQDGDIIFAEFRYLNESE